jgi:hypothetical protein
VLDVARLLGLPAVPASSYGTHCTKSAELWWPAPSRSVGSMVVWMYHSMVGNSASSPFCTAANPSRSERITSFSSGRR